MTWFYVDDRFHSHVKVENVPNAALGLWVKVGSWCAQNLTNGVFSETTIKQQKGRKSQVKALLDAGLWELDATTGQYRFHDWIQCNPERQRILEKRAENASRMRSVRKSKAAAVPKPAAGQQAKCRGTVSQTSGKSLGNVAEPSGRVVKNQQLTPNVQTHLFPDPFPLTQEVKKKEDPPPAISDPVRSAQEPGSEPVPLLRSVPPLPPSKPKPYRTGDLLADYEVERQKAGGEALMDAEKKCHSLLQGVLSWTKTRPNEDPRELCLRSMRNFFADKWRKTNGGWPLRTWAANAAGWFTASDAAAPPPTTPLFYKPYDITRFMPPSAAGAAE